MWRPGGQIGGQEDSVDSRRIDWRLEEQCGGQEDKLETRRAVGRPGGSKVSRRADRRPGGQWGGQEAVRFPGGQCGGQEAAWRQARLSEERPRKAQSRRKGLTISFLKDTGQERMSVLTEI